MLTYKAMFKYLDGGVHAEVLDSPSVITCGRDLEEARRLLASALVDMAETSLSKGESLPQPDPVCTDPDADLEEPIYLLLKAASRIEFDHRVPRQPKKRLPLERLTAAWSGFFLIVCSVFLGCEHMSPPLDVVLKDWQEDPGKPVLFITHTPPIDSHQDLRGVAVNADPDLYAVAVYILVGKGWWNKPTFAAPLTRIRPDHTWTANITTGGQDASASRIAAFLVPADYQPPRAQGGADLPEELFTAAVSYVAMERVRPVQELVFAGRTWWIKEADSQVGPGPNYFSADHAWVDTDGHLHLNIAPRDGRWYSAEVVTSDPVGFGTYTFRLASRVDQLDANVILGLFTWNDDPAFAHREIDIELARWGDPANDNAQFVLQPFQDPSRIFRFPWTQAAATSTHWFDWRAERVSFGSQPGNVDATLDGAQWQFSGPDIPPPGPGTHVRINLWLLNGQAPFDGQAVEVIISDFQFEPTAVRDR